MSYEKIEMIGIVCDNCGELFEEKYTGYTAYNDKDQAYEYATYDGWHATYDNKHYCPKCHEIDDDDNLIIKPAPEGR